jgi:hypothetical protein
MCKQQSSHLRIILTLAPRARAITADNTSRSTHFMVVVVMTMMMGKLVAINNNHNGWIVVKLRK